MTARARARGVVSEREFQALLVLPLLYFLRPLFFDTFFFRDLHLLTYFQRLKTAACLRAGELPLWDPFLHGGQPLLSVLTNTALYPSNLLYTVLPGVAAFNLEIVGHLAMAGAAAYAAARTLGLSPAASLLAGVSFELCGYQLSLANHLNRLIAMPWAALSFLFWTRYLEERRTRWVAASALAGGLMGLAGFPELFLLQVCFLGVWTVGFARERVLPALGGLAAAWALAAGLAAVQLVPGALHARGSSRVAEGARAPLQWSLPPQELPELAIPGFFGRVDTLPESDYWGRSLQDQGFPYVVSLYFGVPFLLLAVAGAAAPSGGSLLSPGARTALGLAALASLVLSLGRFLPGFPALARVDVFHFRYPVKFLAAGLLPAALLAAVGAEALLGGAAGSFGRRVRAVAAVGSASLLAVGTAIFWLPDVARDFERIVFRVEPAAAFRAGLGGAFLHAAIAGALFSLLSASRSLPDAARGWALAALVATDLGVAGLPVTPLAPRTLLTREPPLSDLVRSVVGDGRLFRDDDPRPLRLKAPTPDIVWLARWNLDSLAKYTASGFRIPVVFHLDFDGLAGRDVSALGEAVRRMPWERRLPFLSAAGVRAVLREKGSAVPGLLPFAELPVDETRALVLERNPAALPPASLSTGWVRADTVPEALAAMGDPTFEASRRPVVPGEDRPPDPACAPRLRTVNGEGTPEAVYEVRSGCRSLLVRTTPLQPGWRATVDGVGTPVVRTNGIFQGVFVPPGDHLVRFAYRPPGLAAGAVVSFLSLVLLGLLARYPRSP